MRIDDERLAAAGELSSPAAVEVLRPAVVAAGGTLHDARCSQIHYLPGRELVARYDCDITWPDGRRRDTLLAATSHGDSARGISLAGALKVTAETASGTLEAAVWRWPFDPVLVALEGATSRRVLDSTLAGVVPGVSQIEVVAYRPTERAVMRVLDHEGRTYYLKVLPPELVEGIVTRHEMLRAAGVCAPEVLHADESTGLLLLHAMPGRTLRDLIKCGGGVWPETTALVGLLTNISGIDPRSSVGPTRASRTRDAIAHLQLLNTVVPESADLLEDLAGRFDAALEDVAARSGAVVHGDLHEAQLFVDDAGAVVGLIDLDDLGPGDPVDDPAVLLGHLEYRALTTDDADTATSLRGRTADLRNHFATIHGAAVVDLTTAAVLVGLATGPFRGQIPNWRQVTLEVLERARRHAAAADGVLSASTVHE